MISLRSNRVGFFSWLMSGLPLLALCLAGSARAQGASGGDIYSRKVGDSTARLIDVSLDVLLNGGAASEPDTVTQGLQQGGHDPNKRGFTLAQAEISLAGAVDPYLTAEGHLIAFIDPDGRTGVELEEAFVTTTSLPWDLQIKAGQFFTEFGRINHVHPHAWRWIDQPVANSRMFGADGLRSPGLRVSWLTPTPWYSELFLGMQNASGETATSFLADQDVYTERSVGGRPFVERPVRNPGDMLYLARLENAWDVSDTVSTKLAGSALLGPNATGRNGRTAVWGGDLVVKWRPSAARQGWPFLVWESEVMRRDFKADLFDNGLITIPEETLRDWGFYTQALWGFYRRWAAGARYEYAGGSKDGVLAEDTDADGTLDTLTPVARSADPLRDNRHRLSPLLIWQFSEFARLRAQYNYDRAGHLPKGEAHEAWASLEFLIGAHPAHKY